MSTSTLHALLFFFIFVSLFVYAHKTTKKWTTLPTNNHIYLTEGMEMHLPERDSKTIDYENYHKPIVGMH